VSVTKETWPRPHRLTVDEYYRMAAVGLLPPDARVELIEGEIIDMAPIGSRHAAAVDRLAKLLILAVDKSAIVRVQGPVRLSVHSEPQPDLAVLRPRADDYRDSHPETSDILLLIEVSDTTLRFDREVKAGLYARHGIPALWILDIGDGRLHVFRAPRRGEYTERTDVAAGPVEIPGLGIDVDFSELF
jgi:Uma2 family endonuclease